LKARRKELGLSQEQLGRKHPEDLSQTSVSTWERGQVCPTLRSFILWARALDLEIELVDIVEEDQSDAEA
jgi:transcriptional regulator with XRE-family HTH domain